MTDAPPGQPRAGTFRAAWTHRRWRWLLSGFAVSLTGSYLYSIALAVYLIDRTGSATWVAVAVVARLLPRALLSAPAGVLADRFNRRRLMVRLDMALTIVMLAIAAVAWADGPVWLAVGLAVIASALATPYAPAAVAATPHLVGEDDLAAANAAESIIAQAAWFVGPALGALVVAVVDPGAAFVINGATFAVSAFLVSRIGEAGGGATTPRDDDRAERGGVPESSAGRSGAVEPVTPTRPSGVRAQVAEGARAVRSDPGLFALTAFVCAMLFSFGMEQVLHVLVAVDRLGLGAEWVGVMGAAIGAGGLLVAPMTARLGRSSSIGLVLVVSGLATGLPSIGLALTTSPAMVLVVLAVEGAATIVNEVLLITLLQRACPEHLLARVYGLQESTSTITQLLGSALAPVFVAIVGLSVGLWVGGGVTVVASLLLAPALLKLAARTERGRHELAPTVRRLRGLALFAEASEATLERLARSAETVAATRGQVILSEGDLPDDLYVVQTGHLRVTSRGTSGGPGREVNQMGPDDWFGEIGLLRSIPRTATVTAATDCLLLRLPGQVFIDAMGSPELLPEPIRRNMAIRYARTHPPSDDS